jgi:hypothetical protein
MGQRTHAHSRRDILRLAGAALTGSAAIGLAGCVDEDNPAFDVANPLARSAGGTTPGGEIPTYQDVYREDADVIVADAGTLEQELAAGNGQIVWVDSDTHIDMTGQNATLDNTVLASGRSEGDSGALITTDDRGMDSLTRDPALFEVGEGARITGVELRGPHYDFTDSDVIPGYIPMAPGGSYDVRQQWRDDWYARAISVRGENSQVDNCEIWGWSAGIAVGSQSTEVSPDIMYNAIHNCMMTSAGYPIDVRHGTPVIYRCWFDAYRHAVNGSGLSDAGYYVLECTFGPHASSFPIDMHRVDENQSGSSDSGALDYRSRAGGTMVVQDSQVMPTNIVDDSYHNEGSGYVNHRPGGETPHVHVRGIPADGFWFEGNVCAHPDPQTALNQTIPDGYSGDENGWYDIYENGNEWGVDFSDTDENSDGEDDDGANGDDDG